MARYRTRHRPSSKPIFIILWPVKLKGKLILDGRIHRYTGADLGSWYLRNGSLHPWNVHSFSYLLQRKLETYNKILSNLMYYAIHITYCPVSLSKWRCHWINILRRFVISYPLLRQCSTLYYYFTWIIQTNLYILMHVCVYCCVRWLVS